MAEHGSDAPVRTVTYQGVPGAFSYEACGQAEPDLYAVPCTSFEERAGPRGLDRDRDLISGIF